jgi:hypothetical protein
VTSPRAVALRIRKATASLAIARLDNAITRLESDVRAVAAQLDRERRPVNRRPMITALFALCLLLAGGCASTPFVRGVQEYGPDVADELRDYVEADETLDTATRAERLAAADALEAAQRDEPVTLDAVRAAWQRTREAYAAYVDADADLSPPEKTLRAKNVARMDRLVEAEGARWIYAGGGGG